MEAGLVAMGHASLKLSPLHGMEGKNVLNVSSVKTAPEHRHTGEATRLLNEICRRADMSQFLLVLTPARFDAGPLDDKELERWYAKFGFERIQDKPILMCREPKRKVWSIETDEVAEVGGH